jgi:Protein of unknown function (DUF1353)
VKIPFYLCLTSAFLVTGCIPTSTMEHRSGPVKQQVAKRQRPEAPTLKRLKNGHYKVSEPWTVTIQGLSWHIPAGYTSNGITAPARIKSALGDGVGHRETWAAVFHDWLFTQGGVTRKQADRMFRDLLIGYGVSARKADLMYTFVSAFSTSKSLRPSRNQ